MKSRNASEPLYFRGHDVHVALTTMLGASSEAIYERADVLIYMDSNSLSRLKAV